MPAPVKLYLASSNPGKLNEFRALAQATQISADSTPPGNAGIPAGSGLTVDLALAPWFNSLPEFEEDAPTFAENALGKALHYSRGHDGFVFADDSGLVVPSLGGAPGVKSARYTGPGATSEQRNTKLLAEMRDKTGPQRAAYFVCATALVEQGHTLAVVTDRADGLILESPQGEGGFGYDPVFYVPELGKTFAELSPAEKNTHSHRGKAFRCLLALMKDMFPVKGTTLAGAVNPDFTGL